MYKIAKITFKPLINNKDESLNSLDLLLNSLRNNGQILSRFVIEEDNGCYVVRVCITDDDALEDKYYNNFFKENSVDFDISFEILNDELYSTDSCCCKKHSYLIMMPDIEEDSSPIYCGDCKKEISVIHLPYLYNDESHYSILNYQETYQAVIKLWYEGLSDRFTKNQLTNYNSKLNKDGINLCQELEKKTGIPTYMFIRNPIGGWYQYEKNNKNVLVCPKCGKDFRKVNFDGYKVCDDCRLAFWHNENI